MRRSIQTITLALAVTTAPAVSLSAAPPAAADPAHAGTLDGAPTGLLGCYSGVTATAHRSCVVAWQAQDGVHVVVLADAGTGIVPPKYVEEAVVAAGALRPVAGGVELQAHLPRTGEISLRSTGGVKVPVADNHGCSSYPLRYDLVASGGAFAIASTTTGGGTVGGVAVSSQRCNAHFTGPTSGVWALAVLVEESALP